MSSRSMAIFRVAFIKSHVGEHSFAVLLGDDIIDSRDPLLDQMLRLHEETGDNVIALMEVPRDQISGCLAAYCRASVS